ncbi:hypothetical protein TBLA_0A03190 [Henningerozyma blattae CBS 6284]|uniref:Protein phosphatase n=1 Tax=Henningerozyma blattae (strain ATCC 34711 / CBS 6284 / DSM 70876 / NBRC 10599 / NRRL Y-10934 / UCD 77-7) TaxID=1071380 RepID=I2GVG7_HENB6|nr:hypothetical protein TBLA_0A03190 [Tetrapisispora blattae CBS 6284]CCH58119.1 hypothetical protein TBLA_0A03190 [Tetrapisispora blattae CBS 6284]
MFCSSSLRPLRGSITSVYKISKISSHSATKLLIKRTFVNGSWTTYNKSYSNYNSSNNSNSNDGGSSNSNYTHHHQLQDTPNNTFSYNTSVAYQPKDREDQIYKKLIASKKSPTGEDNLFINCSSLNDEVFAAVADGVGGWAEYGFDSSAISRELCENLNVFSNSFFQLQTTNAVTKAPKELLDLAYLKTKKDGIVEIGSTTALVAHLDPKGCLQIANLGDSWCGVFRDNKLIFQTENQLLGFNTPFQLSIIPDSFLKARNQNKNSYIQNLPSDADEYSFQLKPNDIVILATDGVTDNIATGDIELYLKDNYDNKQLNNKELQDLTSKLVQNIVKISKDENFPSVFAQEYTNYTGVPCKGGKQDDITMILIRVN